MVCGVSADDGAPSVVLSSDKYEIHFGTDNAILDHDSVDHD